MAASEDINHVQYGKLLLAAKVGELCPAMTREETGARKGSTPEVQPFHRNTLADYRKLAKHQRG
ncbi:MAG: hypothetical protein ABIP48_09525 [Planctomycetota bacterium]